MKSLPRGCAGQWLGAAVVAGCWGSGLARAWAEARLTSDGGAAATHGGVEDGTTVPASKGRRNLV